jgi:hypothetical protein
MLFIGIIERAAHRRRHRQTDGRLERQTVTALTAVSNHRVLSRYLAGLLIH